RRRDRPEGHRARRLHALRRALVDRRARASGCAPGRLAGRAHPDPGRRRAARPRARIAAAERRARPLRLAAPVPRRVLDRRAPEGLVARPLPTRGADIGPRTPGPAERARRRERALQEIRDPMLQYPARAGVRIAGTEPMVPLLFDLASD